MRKDITVIAEPRPARGKNEARRLRARGFSPAVLYGGGAEPIAVSVSPKEVLKILHSKSGHNTIFNLQVGEQIEPAMIVDWQEDPVKGALLHVDFKRIDLARRIAVKVPVHPVGEPRGVKQQGGLHEIITREIEIECLPDEIPEEFAVDVTELLIGQSLRAGDIPMTGSMRLLTAADTVISHVIALRTSTVSEAPVEAAESSGAAKPAEKTEKKEEKKEKK